MECSLIYNENREFLSELNDITLYMERCKAAYSSKMDEFQINLDSGSIHSDIAIDTFMESADNGLLARVKLAFMKIKEAFIKFIDKVIIRLKETSMISRLQKAKEELAKYNEFLPKQYMVKFSEETISEVGKIFDIMTKGLEPFKSLNSKKTASMINTLEVTLNKLTNRMKTEVTKGAVVNPRNFSKAIDNCIADINCISKFRTEFISTYDKVVAQLRDGKRIAEAITCQEGLNSFTKAVQKLTNIVIQYSRDVLSASASMVSEAKKLKNTAESVCCADYIPDKLISESGKYAGYQSKIDRFMAETASEYYNAISEMQVKIDNDELMSEYAIDLYMEKADNAFVNKLKIAIIKIRDSFLNFVEKISERLKASAVKRKSKEFSERLNTLSQYVNYAEQYDFKYSKDVQKKVDAIASKLVKSISDSVKYISPELVDNVTYDTDSYMKSLDLLPMNGHPISANEATYLFTVSVQRLDVFLADKKRVSIICKDIVKMLDHEKKYDEAYNCQRALSMLMHVYHKLIMIQVSVVYETMRICETILKKAELDAVKKM